MKWFENHYLRAKHEFGIQDQDTWNFDEIGFRVGVGGKQRVIITKNKNRKLFHGDADDREHLTSGEFISGGGRSISPFVILKGQYHLEKFYFDGGFNTNTSIDLLESGYLINELAIPLMEHFDKQTSKFTMGRWRILI